MIFLIFSLAIWRISYMAWTEAGPFNVFGKIRGVFIKETEAGIQTKLLGNLLLCIKCISAWVSMPFAWYLSNNLLEFAAYTAALSAAAIFVNAVHARSE